MDLAGTVDDANVTSAFADLRAGQFEVRVLGAYRAAAVPSH